MNRISLVTENKTTIFNPYCPKGPYPHQILMRQASNLISNFKVRVMENQKSKPGTEFITAIVVIIVIIILIISKSSEIKKENTMLRQGSDSSAKK